MQRSVLERNWAMLSWELRNATELLVSTMSCTFQITSQHPKHNRLASLETRKSSRRLILVFMLWWSSLTVVVRPFYECPTIRTGSYNSSRYCSSSSLNSLPLAASASSILSTLEKPMIGLETRLLIHARATWLIFQSCFFAISSTRPMIFLSRSLLPELWLPAFCSPSERVVEPKAEGGRARWPRQRGAH